MDFITRPPRFLMEMYLQWATRSLIKIIAKSVTIACLTLNVMFVLVRGWWFGEFLKLLEHNVQLIERLMRIIFLTEKRNLKTSIIKKILKRQIELQKLSTQISAKNCLIVPLKVCCVFLRGKTRTSPEFLLVSPCLL